MTGASAQRSPLKLAARRIHALTFAPPSVINDTPGAHAKAKREARAILREMAWYFGRETFRELVEEATKGRKGNTPDEMLNALILAEWDLAWAPEKKKFSRELGKKYPRQYRLQSPGAVLQRLRRLLKARPQRDQEFASQKRGGSFL
jgi:hypothetical protein